MHHLNLGYLDIASMPWEYVEWFYNRHVQHLIDLKKAENEQHNIFGI